MARRGLLVQTERPQTLQDGCRDRGNAVLPAILTQNGTKKGAAVAGGSKVITGRRQNRVDRSHSMSMKMDAPS